MKRIILCILLIFPILSYSKQEIRITIVDIGDNNRLEIGEQLRIINKYSPKMVCLDFHLIYDSLDRDTILVSELNKINNSLQVVQLHNFIEPLDYWDSLEISHPKFNIKFHGFSNVTADTDTVFEKILPMSQAFQNQKVSSFAFVAALNSFRLRTRYQDTGFEYLRLKLRGLGKCYKIITRHDLASGNFSKEDLDNKIVLLGYIGPKEDYFYIDKKRTKKINGVEIQAAIINELLAR